MFSSEARLMPLVWMMLASSQPRSPQCFSLESNSSRMAISSRKYCHFVLSMIQLYRKPIGGQLS